MKTFSLIYVFVLLISNISLASVIKSSKTGNWTNSNTWKNNATPSIHDTVFVSIGDTIFINSSFLKCALLNNSGVVFFKSATNYLEADNVILKSGIVTGNSLGTIVTESVFSEGKSEIGKCNLKVLDSIINIDTLIFTSSSGNKFFNKLINEGTISNIANEDLNIASILANRGQFNFFSGKIFFTSFGEIYGNILIEKLSITDSLVSHDTLLIQEKIEGNGHIRNEGILKLGMTDGNFKIDSLILTAQKNELHLIRNGYQSLPYISFNEINVLKCTGYGSYSINSSQNSIKTLIIENESNLTIENAQTINSITIKNFSKLISKGSFKLDNIPNLNFETFSYLILENNQTFLKPIQIGHVEIESDITLTANDSLYVSGDFTGNGKLNGSLIVEYNGVQRQTIKELDYKTLVYNNSSPDSSILYGSNKIERLSIKKGDLKLGSHSINKCEIYEESAIIIGGHSPVFKDTLKISGKFLINSSNAIPDFYFIYISPTGIFQNNSSADVTIEKGITNNGSFIGCNGTACDYHFIKDSTFISGSDTVFISRLHGKTIINHGVLSIKKKIIVDSLINESVLVLQVDSQNIDGEFIFNSTSNSLVFNKNGDQNIPLTITAVNNLIIKNSGNKILTNNILINGDLTIGNFSSLKCDSFQLHGNQNGKIKIDSLGSLKIGHNLNNQDIIFPTLFKDIELHDSSTVYYLAKGNQTISSLPIYGNITIDDGAVDSSFKTLSGDNLLIKGNLTLSESSLILMIDENLIDLKGDWNGPGKINLTSGVFKIEGDGNSDGELNAGNSEVIYCGSKEQKIKIAKYYNLTINKTGKAITKANLGSLDVLNKTWVKNGCLDFNSEEVSIANLIIDDSVTFSSKLQDKRFKEILINNTGRFLLNYDEEVSISGSIHCDGSFICEQGKIHFSDSSKNQSISGLGTIELGQIKVSKDSKKLTISSDLTIIDTLTIESGVININSEVKLDSLGFIVGESNKNAISGAGKIFKNKNIVSGNYFNIGGLGLDIVCQTPLGNTLIERGFQPIELLNQESINRTYNIEPTFNSNLEVTLSFKYWESELNNNLEKDLKIQKSTNNGLSWIEFQSSQDTSSKSITLNSVTSFSKWTAGSNKLNTLAVELINFEGKRIEKNIKLKWEVLSEINSKAYQINFSFDGIQFDSLTTILASNNNIYEHTWFNSPNENIFFELIEIENYGETIHLDTIVILANKDLDPKAWVSNNKIITENFPNGTLSIYNSRGKLVLMNKKDIINLNPGVYYIELSNEISRWIFKFKK